SRKAVRPSDDASHQRLTLRELSPAASTVQTWLLAFLHTRVACQEVLFAQLLVQVAVVLQQRPGNPLHAGTCLAGVSTAVNTNDHVDRLEHFAVGQWGGYRIG